MQAVRVNMQAGRVNTQASRMLRRFSFCSPERLAAMVPALTHRGQGLSAMPPPFGTSAEDAAEVREGVAPA